MKAKQIAQQTNDIHCPPPAGPPTFDATGTIWVGTANVAVGTATAPGTPTATNFVYTFAHTAPSTNVAKNYTNEFSARRIDRRLG